MNICLLNDAFPPVIDGVVNVMMNYADYLEKDHGSKVIVGTPSYPGADYSGYPYKVIPYQSFNTASITNGYRTGNPFVSKAVAQLADFGPDIIHSHCPASATVIARLLRVKTDAPVVFTYHTKYDIDIRRAVRIRPVAEEGIKAMVGNIEACDDIWVVSRGAGESLKALGFEGDYRVMYNGVDFAKGRVSEEEVRKVTQGFDLPEGVPVYLFVGRMITYKGIPMILQALKLLKDSGRDFRMVLIGKGPDRKMLEEMAKEYGLMGDGEHPANCIFTGPVYDRDVLRAWNTRADLFLFPSTFDTNGLVVREAAACGLASVLIRDSCAAEGVTDGRNGFIIDETPQAMAALLQKLGDHPQCMYEAGQHAMDELYLSWRSCVADAYDRYQAVLEKKEKGLLVKRKKQPTDYLVTAAAKGLEESEKIRQVGKELFHDFRETASGMMENFQEAEENAEQKWETFKYDLRRHSDQVRQQSAELKDNLRQQSAELKENLLQQSEDLKENLRQQSEELKENLRQQVLRWN